jgi:hypothetical protein
VRVRVHACAREGALNGAREKETLDRTRRGGVVAIKEATSETVSLDALLLAAVPRAPCWTQMRQPRERKRECGAPRRRGGQAGRCASPTRSAAGRSSAPVRYPLSDGRAAARGGITSRALQVVGPWRTREGGLRLPGLLHTAAHERAAAVAFAAAGRGGGRKREREREMVAAPALVPLAAPLQRHAAAIAAARARARARTCAYATAPLVLRRPRLGVPAPCSPPTSVLAPSHTRAHASAHARRLARIRCGRPCSTVRAVGGSRPHPEADPVRRSRAAASGGRRSAAASAASKHDRQDGSMSDPVSG